MQVNRCCTKRLDDEVESNKRCQSCCSHKCSRHHGCRKDLCTSDFTVRLAGLQDGLHFRLRKMLWCLAEIELEDRKKVTGTIIFVGTNVVELLVKRHDKLDEELVESVGETLDKVFVEQQLEEEMEMFEPCERNHTKGVTWIFSIDKIAKVVVK